MVRERIDRENRSDKYQYLLLEIIVADHGIWNSFEQPHNKSFPISIEMMEYLRGLEDKLQKELVGLIKKHLTPRQYEVLSLYADGYTQMEIAKILNVNQSSITKSLHGNTDYKNGKKIYGGISKKMQNLIGKHHPFKPVMAAIHEVWEPDSIRLPFYQTLRTMLGNETQFEAWLLSAPPAHLKKSKTNSVEHAYASRGLISKQVLSLREKGEAGATVQKLCKELNVKESRVLKILGRK